MKLAWLTDIHLDSLSCQNRRDFYHQVSDLEPDAILISGDIADGEKLEVILHEMICVLQIPIYFVLGNHDYYHSSIRYIRDTIPLLCKDEYNLKWLPDEYIAQKLNSDTFLVGIDGWADGKYGDYVNSDICLNDSLFIEELKKSRILGKRHLWQTMESLADDDVGVLEDDLKRAIHSHYPPPKNIIILTHVPPFEESCLHEGKPTHPDYLPFFASKTMGDMLLKFAQNNKDIEFLCLCGHTHSRAYFKPLDNLVVKTGGATYGKPEIQEIIEI